VDQKSGVSARLPIAARELLISQVERRMVRDPRAGPFPRLVDLSQIVPAITGKVELVLEGEQEGTLQVARHLIGTACRTVFDRHFPDVIREGSEQKPKNLREGAEPRGKSQAREQREPKLKSDRYKPVLDWFAAGNRLEISDEMDDEEYSGELEKVPGLSALAGEFLPQKSKLGRSASMELILEGLHQHSLLAKEDVVSRASYSDMLGVMLEGLK